MAFFLEKVTAWVEWLLWKNREWWSEKVVCLGLFAVNKIYFEYSLLHLASNQLWEYMRRIVRVKMRKNIAEKVRISVNL